MNPDDIFYNELARARGLFGNVPEPGLVFDFNVGGQNPLVSLIGNNLLSQAFGSAGLMPSRFQPGANFVRQQEAKAYYAARQEALTQAAVADRSTHFEVMRGIARLTGTPFGLDQQRSAGVIADDIATVAPYLTAMFPDLYDSLHGSRGSAMVMAQAMHRGGRFSVDPVTGRTGLSGASTAAISREIADQFFGPGSDIGSFRGLSMGQVGLLYDELQNRGLMGRGLGSLSRDDRISLMAADPMSRKSALELLQQSDPQGLAAVVKQVDAARPDLKLTGKTDTEAISVLSGLNKDVAPALEAALKATAPSRVDDLARRFDASQIGGRLKNLAGAVSAMREIFGDMGKPDAPMSEIISGLESLTQGGLAVSTPAELEQIVRKTATLARTTGMGIEAMTSITAQAGSLADQLGLDRGFAVQASQGASAFGAALSRTGALATPLFGGGTRDELTALDAQLRVRAAGSELSNNLAAAVRFVELEENAGRTAEISTKRIGKIAAAARRGQDSVALDPANPGRMTSLAAITADELDVMAHEAGAGDGIMYNMRMGNNQEVIQKYNLSAISRRQQGLEARNFIANGFRGTAIAALNDALGADRARDVADRAGARVGAALFRQFEGAERSRNITPDELADAAARTVKIGEFFEQEVRSVNPALADSLKKRNLFNQIASAGYSQVQRAVPESPGWRGYGSPEKIIQLHAQDTNRAAVDVESEAEAKAVLESAMAGVAKVGPLARIMDLVRAGDATSATDLIGKAAGGQSPDQVIAAVTAIPVKDLMKEGVIKDEDRLTLVMSEFVKLAEASTGLASGPIGTPAEQRARLDRLRDQGRTLAALRIGGEPARVEAERLSALNSTDPAVARQIAALRAAMGGGINTTAERLGIRTQAAVGASQIKDMAEQASLLRSSASGSADASRYAQNVTVGTGRLLSALLGDEDSLRNLGAGGFDQAKAAYDRYRSMVFEAGELGVPLQDVMSGKFQPVTDRQIAAVGRINVGVRDLGEDLAKIQGRAERGEGKLHPVGADELSRLRRFIQSETQSDVARSRDTLDRMTRGLTLSLDPAEKDKLAAMFGSGDSAAQRRDRFERLMSRRNELERTAQGYGLDLPSLHRAVQDESDPNHNLILDRQGVKTRFEELGAFGDSMTRENLSRMIDRTAIAVEDRGTTPIELSGVLRIEGDGQTGRIRATGTSKPRGGSVPLRPLTPTP
jgi:hypothetical protein